MKMKNRFLMITALLLASCSTTLQVDKIGGDSIQIEKASLKEGPNLVFRSGDAILEVPLKKISSLELNNELQKQMDDQIWLGVSFKTKSGFNSDSSFSNAFLSVNDFLQGESADGSVLLPLRLVKKMRNIKAQKSEIKSEKQASDSTSSQKKN